MYGNPDFRLVNRAPPRDPSTDSASDASLQNITERLKHGFYWISFTTSRAQ